MQEKIVYSVCLIGAPCSGKTSVLEGLRQKVVSDNSPDTPNFHFIPDPWDSFAPFAPIFLNQIDHSPREIEAWMRETPFKPTHPDLIKLQEGYSEVNTLFDWYQTLSLHFINNLTNAQSQVDIRNLIQLDLLRLQLRHERALQHTILSQHPTKRTIILTDSACPTVLTYARGIGQQINSDVYERIYLENKRYSFQYEPDSAEYYETLIFLRTLALSPHPEDYSHFYYDGRRLDTPDVSKKIDYWLDRLVKCVSQKIPVVEFGYQTSLNEKVDQLYEYLNSDSFAHNCFFHPYYNGNDWPTKPSLRWC